MTELEARSLTFGYQLGQPLLSDWSQTFRAGEVVAITGPSGKGKSTLLYLLGLMVRPQRGEVLLSGEACSSLPDHRRAFLRAHRFGFVFQDASLDPSRTVLDNVLETSLYRGVPRESMVDRAHELLSRFGVELRADAKPGQVSGGQAQRIALCRALLNDPAVLLADEPTGNLDPSAASVVTQAFKEHANAGAVVVIVTHDPDLAAQCHRIVKL